LGNLKIEVSLYASRRMDQRGISFASVRSTLERPDSVRPDHHGEGRLLARKYLAGKTYYVVFKKEGEDRRIVVTAWFRAGSGLVG
jgi:uncharacterized DUF497 family protein